MDDVVLADESIATLQPRPTAAVRFVRPMADLDVGALFGAAMASLAGWLREREVATAGPPYARYFRFGPDVADMEFGVPLPSVVPDVPAVDGLPEGEVGASSLPGGEVATIVHRGAYPSLGRAYERLGGWLATEGRTASGPPWEEYVDDPSVVTDVSRLRTLVCMPLA